MPAMCGKSHLSYAHEHLKTSHLRQQAAQHAAMLSTRPKYGEPRTERREGPSAALLLQLGAGANSNGSARPACTAYSPRLMITPDEALRILEAKEREMAVGRGSVSSARQAEARQQAKPPLLDQARTARARDREVASPRHSTRRGDADEPGSPVDGAGAACDDDGAAATATPSAAAGSRRSSPEAPAYDGSLSEPGDETLVERKLRRARQMPLAERRARRYSKPGSPVDGAGAACDDDGAAAAATRTTAAGSRQSSPGAPAASPHDGSAGQALCDTFNASTVEYSRDDDGGSSSSDIQVRAPLSAPGRRDWGHYGSLFGPGDEILVAQRLSRARQMPHAERLAVRYSKLHSKAL